MLLYLQILAGFILLIGGAEYLVRGAVSLAQKMGVSAMVIGMTIVAFGTSAPEFLVTINATLHGSPGIALGNVVGSNIANILLILGAACLVTPIRDMPEGIRRDAVVLISGTMIFAWLCWNGDLGRTQGLILLGLFVAFIGYSTWREMSFGDEPVVESRIEEVEELQTLKDHPMKAWIALVGGFVGLIYGADVLVDGAVVLARQFNVSEEVIGLTVIALGTSLPELAASTVAAIRGHAELAIGNVVGSNLFNILGVAGVAAVITPLEISQDMYSFDLLVMVGATLAVLPFMFSPWGFPRIVGLLFVIGYGGFIWAQQI